MRSASTVSGPLLSVSTPHSRQNRFTAVHLLTGQLLYFIVEGKTRVKEVYLQLKTYMIAQGMINVDQFELAFFLDDEYFFADLESKLSKYSPKNWKSSSTYGLDQNGQPLLQFHLRVKFYVDTTKSLRNDVTRQHYYLQLRKNIADRSGTTEDNEQSVLPLVALSLQADLGDYGPDTDISSELLEQYLPSKVYKFNEYKVKQKLITLYKNHKGMSKSRAQTTFIQEAGIKHKSHLYRLRLNKSQPKNTQARALFVRNCVLLAISTNGVQLFNENLSQELSCLFLWNNIVKLCFDRKKFEIRQSNAERLVYYTNSDEKSKRILALCKETHQYCMNVHPNLLETLLNNNTPDKSAFEGLKWVEDVNEEKIISKIYAKKNVDKDKKENEQKCENGVRSESIVSKADEPVTAGAREQVPNGGSVLSSVMELGYSHTEQNLTISELDYSVQSAQDSSEAYLQMYRHPRARSAYVDNSNQSARTSSGVYTCASYSSESKDEASVSYCCSESADCNDSGYDKATAIADSAYGASLPPATVAADDDMNSATTADRQVVGVDDCDGISGTDELYDLSAAATSESSYCGVGGVTSTVTNTSDVVSPPPSSAGCGGNRSRSGSVVSNSGSFRGDGSDPPEGGHGACLTAIELSNLIVGKTSETPRRGYYPSRPTTSSTLDSDSDYVTLPPPMTFLTGAPSLSNLSLANFDCGTGSTVHWDVRRPLDVLQPNNVVNYCGGHHGHPHHPVHQQCVVNSNNYLDVHKSGTAFYHHIYPTAAVGSSSAVPPLLHAQQPPPLLHAQQPQPLLHAQQPPLLLHAQQPPPVPPPPRPKRFDLQLEQYKQQLRSDVDFVVYPLQDPAVSRQEYVDAKLARGRQHQQQYHRYYGCDPPSYQANAHLYRSTPNVAATVSPPPLPPPPASASSLSRHQYHHHHYHRHHHLNQPPPPLPPLPPHLKYASNQDLLFSATATAGMAHHHRLQPLPRPVRTYSHDDLLAATAPVRPPKLVLRRRPPPPPPPDDGLKNPVAVVPSRQASDMDVATASASVALDIESLRVKSRNLDLPLISALCNDQTLLKQTNAQLQVTENKATQATVSASSSRTAVTVAAVGTSSHRPPPSATGLQTAAAIVANNKSTNCARCTNGTSSFSSPPPPSFLSAAAASPAIVTASPAIVTASVSAVVKTAISKPNHVNKTKSNVV